MQKIKPRKTKEFERDDKGAILMSKDNLKLICEQEDGLYEVPDLNEKIYLHFKGFAKIQNLDEYINLRSIWLENNCLKKIENLEKLPHITCLFLQNNQIEEISGLSHCVNLKILNLSHNRLKNLSNLQYLTTLENFDVSHNQLISPESIENLSQCPSLTNIDFSNNYFDYDEKYLSIFMKMPNLACLYLRNMNIIREFPNYRKRFLSSLPNLKYLDERPVFPEERRISDAWFSGGKEAEQEMRKIIQDEKRKHHQIVAEDSRRKTEETNIRRKNLYENSLKNYEIEIQKYKLLKEEAIKEGKSERYLSLIQEDIDREELKIKDLRENLEHLSVFQPNPYKYFSSTRNEEGDIVILNKTDEEANFIKKNLIINEEEKKEDIENNNINEFDNAEKILEKAGVQLADIEEKNNYWDNQYDNLLETILEFFKFDFGKTTIEFNRIINEIEKKIGKENKDFKEEELRKKWTEIELKIRALNGNRKTFKDKIKEFEEKSCVSNNPLEELE